jgi:HK97 family phage portal protein
MRIPGTGLEIVSRKSAIAQPVSNAPGGGWFPWIIREPFAGAFQRDIEWTVDTAVMNPTVFACVSLIQSDIGKLRLKLMMDTKDGIGVETTSPAFSPVLNKPNSYQNHIQFVEAWMNSKLLHGRTYVLKVRDARNVVVNLFILNPLLVQPMVTPDGTIFYNLMADNLADLQQAQVMVPASEIIHDRWNCLFHPLCGISPLFAAAYAASLGTDIERNSSKFFRNGARPGGVLSAPGAIGDETAKRLKDYWDSNFTGHNSGKVAVLGDGLKYEQMMMTAIDAQTIQQLNWAAETICSCFHMPAYKINVGSMPTNTNIEALAQDYYSQCLQTLIESLELCLTEGLGMDTASPTPYWVESDLDGLLRMDTASLWTALGTAVKSTLMTPNDARRRMGLPPLPGGDALYLQQQNFSLEALAKRDSLPNPFVLDKPATNPTPDTTGPAVTADPETAAAKSLEMQTKFLAAFQSELETV